MHCAVRLQHHNRCTLRIRTTSFVVHHTVVPPLPPFCVTMATRLKPAADETEVEVRWEDQQKIGRFGVLTDAKNELLDEIKVAEVRAAGQYLSAAAVHTHANRHRRSSSPTRTGWMQSKRVS